MRAQLDEDELVLLLEVDARAWLGEEMTLAQSLCAVSKESANVFAHQPVADHRRVVGRHLVVGPLGVQEH